MSTRRKDPLGGGDTGQPLFTTDDDDEKVQYSARNRVTTSPSLSESKHSLSSSALTSEVEKHQQTRKKKQDGIKSKTKQYTLRLKQLPKLRSDVTDYSEFTTEEGSTSSAEQSMSSTSGNINPPPSPARSSTGTLTPERDILISSTDMGATGQSDSYDTETTATVYGHATRRSKLLYRLGKVSKKHGGKKEGVKSRIKIQETRGKIQFDKPIKREPSKKKKSGKTWKNFNIEGTLAEIGKKVAEMSVTYENWRDEVEDAQRRYMRDITDFEHEMNSCYLIISKVIKDIGKRIVRTQRPDTTDNDKKVLTSASNDPRHGNSTQDKSEDYYDVLDCFPTAVQEQAGWEFKLTEKEIGQGEQLQSGFT